MSNEKQCSRSHVHFSTFTISFHVSAEEMRREILAATAGKILKGALPTLNRLPQSLRSSQLKSNVAAEFQDSSYEEEDSSESDEEIGYDDIAE